MGFQHDGAGRRARAMVELTPGRCIATDPRTRRRCATVWAASLPQRLFCARCKARMEQQRHRARQRTLTSDTSDTV